MPSLPGRASQIARLQVNLTSATGAAPVTARPQPAPSVSLYERDIVAWSEQQASLLRAGRLAELDIANIAEEIEDLGKSE